MQEAGENPRLDPERDHQAGWLVFNDEVMTGTDNTGFKVKPDTSSVTSLGYFSSLCHNDKGSKQLAFLRAVTCM